MNQPQYMLLCQHVKAWWRTYDYWKNEMVWFKERLLELYVVETLVYNQELGLEWLKW